MKLQEIIDRDLKEAMRDRNGIRLSTLRLLKAAITNAAIQKARTQLGDAEVATVIQKQAKQREDAILNYEKGNRPELAQKEREELDVLESYLPKPMTDGELNQAIDGVLVRLKAENRIHPGSAIKEVMAEVAGRADGKRISVLVSQKLAQHN